MNRIENLRKSLNVKNEDGKKSLQHTVKHAKFLPFQTRNPERAKFSNGFEPVLGELFRKIEGYRLKEDINIEQVIQDICSQVQVSDEDRPYLENILESYIYQSTSMRLFHPSVFKYIPLSKNKEFVGEREIAQYILDSLIPEDREIKGIMELKDNEHVLTRLICSRLPILENVETGKVYAEAFPFISEVFKEDLNTILSKREFFMSHINLFLAYYYFFLVTQLTLKLNQFGKMNIEAPTPVFYNLDWENSNHNRSAVTKGFKMVVESAKRVLIHINTLEQLNIFMGTKNLLYPELIKLYENQSPEDKQVTLQYLNEWIHEYMEVAVGTSEDLQTAATFDDGIHLLQEQIVKAYEKPTMQGQTSRYALSLTEIGKLYFLKTRGSLGYTLNVNQDFLLLLTALCVKCEKISLKQLFKEYERRGIYFDRYSREAIIELLNKLNLIEKKSDSGDAQYVKPIL